MSSSTPSQLLTANPKTHLLESHALRGGQLHGRQVCVPSYLLASNALAVGMSWWQAVGIIVVANFIVLIPLVLTGPFSLPEHCRLNVSELSASPSELLQACSVTQRTLNVTQRALNVTQRALSVTQRALSVTQRALSVTQRALSVTQENDARARQRERVDTGCSGGGEARV